MTDPPGTPGDDIRRPLDESFPSDPPAHSSVGPAPATAANEPDRAPLRPAVPADAPAPATATVSAEPAEPAALPAEPTGPAALPAEPTGPLRTAQLVWGGRFLRAADLAREAPAQAAGSVAAWTGRPAGRLALPGLLIAALLGVALSTGAYLVPTGQGDGATGPGPAGDPSGSSPPTPPAVGLPPPPPPLNTPGSVPTGQGNPAEALAGWAEQMSARTGVPVVALSAYGYAELAATATSPRCRLSWTTLAAIGRVESNHGSSGGATLLADGRALPPVYGLPLDGGGDRARILDTDAGALDADPIYDRAVGPMQFIPTTWQLEAVDATGDGIADVHNIYDAALAAANYLCRSARDLATAEGWWSAVLSYNAVQSYAEAVFAAANEYGRQSRAGA